MLKFSILLMFNHLYYFLFFVSLQPSTSRIIPASIVINRLERSLFNQSWSGIFKFRYNKKNNRFFASHWIVENNLDNLLVFFYFIACFYTFVFTKQVYPYLVSVLHMIKFLKIKVHKFKDHWNIVLIYS